MSKIRVYELAQKLGLENKTLLEKLQSAGVDAKNVHSRYITLQ